MADSRKPTLSKVAEEFPSLIGLADNLRLSALGKSEEASRSRGAALVRQLALERSRSEKDSGAVQQATARLARQVERQANLATARQAAELGRKIQPGQVTVLGRVLDHRGRPALNLRVFLSNERDLKKPLQRSQLESRGFYLIGVPRDEFDSYFNRSKEIVVTVTNKERQVLAQVRRPFQADNGTVRVFNLVLPPPTPKNGRRLQDIRGIDPRRLQILKQEGIQYLPQLAAMQPDQLVQLLQISRSQADQILKQAREWSQGESNQ